MWTLNAESKKAIIKDLFGIEEFEQVEELEHVEELDDIKKLT